MSPAFLTLSEFLDAVTAAYRRSRDTGDQVPDTLTPSMLDAVRSRDPQVQQLVSLARAALVAARASNEPAPLLWDCLIAAQHAYNRASQ